MTERDFKYRHCFKYLQTENHQGHLNNLLPPQPGNYDDHLILIAVVKLLLLLRFSFVFAFLDAQSPLVASRSQLRGQHISFCRSSELLYLAEKEKNDVSGT